jgi:hypothetical protein
MAVSGFKDAVVTGWRCSLNLFLWLPLYVTSLLLGLIQTWPLLAQAELLTSPQLGSLATGGIDAWVNFLMGSRQAQTQAGATILIWLLLSLVAVALYNLAYDFFAGGILSVWAGTRSFWAGCSYTFWTFVGLSLLQLILVSQILLITVIAASFLGFSVLIIGGLLILLVNLVGEYAHSLAAVQGGRNSFKLIGSAFMFSLRHSGEVLSLGGLGTSLHIGVVVLYLALGSLAGRTATLPLIQQMIILLWLWVKLLRLAWALSYVQATRRDTPELPAGGIA